MEARRRPGLSFAAVALAAACASRSGGDAGVGAPAVDLRAVLLLAYPEFRGTRVVEARATVARTSPAPDAGVLWDAQRAVLADGFEAVDGGAGELGWRAARGPYRLEAHWSGGALEEEATLPLSADDVSHLFGNSHAPGSEALEHLLPGKRPGAARRFRLELIWDAAEERAGLIVCQAVRGLGRAGWRSSDFPAGWETSSLPDGGMVPLPQDALVRLLREDLGTRLTFERGGGRVRVVYEQPLR